MSPQELRQPDRRECERCGRTEVWDADRFTWKIAETESGKSIGDPYCIHEWDINGSFRPFGTENGS